jgi:hypothetical protein
MALGSHRFQGDAEGVDAISWADGLYFWYEQISCNNLGLFETKI